MAVIARGTMKPPLGAQVNPDHPFTRGLIFALLAQEGVGRPSITLGIKTPGFSLTYGTAYSWTSNREGVAWLTSANGSRIVLTAPPAWLPTTGITITLIIRQTGPKPDNMIAVVGGGAVNVYVPYSDNTVYWDFGGTSAPNRLSVSGLTFSSTLPDKWIFTAGPQGSSIWQNGIKRASQSTAVTRSGAAGEAFYLNNLEVSPLDINYAAVADGQWADDLCRWWSAEPYAHLYPEGARTFITLTAVSDTVIDLSRPRSGFGAQKPSRRLHGRK